MVNGQRGDATVSKKRRPSWKLVLGSFVFIIIMGVSAFAGAVYLFPVPQPNDVAVAESTKVLYADGKKVIGRIGDVRRTCIPLTEVPEQAQQAILAAEDRDFYGHGGFDIAAISRALVNNFTGGSTQGGSTITQQYVKNAYLTHEQSLVRKAKELLLAIKLETFESKDEILENYSCTIYWGRGGYGIQAASELYFGKSAKNLTLSESVAIAAMIQSPGNYEPSEHEEQLRDRMDYVIEGMVEKGWVTQAEADDVEMPKFKKRPRGNVLAGQTGYLLEAVRREMIEVGWSEAELEGGGLTITTTIDKQAQDAAVEAVKTAGPQYNTEGLRIGLSAVEPGTGKIRASYGGENYLEDQLDNAMQARAQAGSTFKPFALATALEQDYGLTSVWNGSSPAYISGYSIENYGNASYGPVSLLQATQNSINTAYVEIENTVGVDRTIDSAFRAGLPEDTPGIEENLTFVLGTSSPRPIDMASAFSTFAARGIQAPPTMIQSVERSGGESAYKISDRGEREFEEDTMDTLNTALQAVVNSGTATRASWIGRPVAGKTGTTDDAKSAWFVGYTPQLATAVMMTKENKKGHPISLNGTGGVGNMVGGSFPTAIGAEFLRGALEGEPAEPFVAGSYGGSTGGYTPEPQESPTQTPSESPSATPSPTESSASPSATAVSPTPSDSGTVTQSPTSQPLPKPSVSTTTPTPDPDPSADGPAR